MTFPLLRIHAASSALFSVALLVQPAVAADAVSTSSAAQATQSSQLWSAWGGTVGMRWNRELAADIGLRFAQPTGRLPESSARQHELFPLRQAGSIDFRVSNGNLQSFVGGSLQARGGYVLKTRGGDIDLTDFRLRTRADDPLVLDLVGADGKAWFYIDRLMYELIDDNRVLAVRTMDVRISPELADRLGHPDMARWAIADMEMTTQVLRQGSGAEPKGGTVFDWAGTPVPGHPGEVFEADLFMKTFSVQYSRCNGCTGTSSTGQVVFTPSSTLQNNVNNGTAVATIPGDPLGTSTALWTADIPWYSKFSGTFPPYDNDQHPFLIWNMYRFNPDGSIDQIGRSGVKHAFLTTNQGCAAGHGTNPHILGRQCSDTYGTGNNDSNNDLGPRSEIIPATNQWGRCGSIYDTNCDGSQDCFRQRKLLAAPDRGRGADGSGRADRGDLPVRIVVPRPRGHQHLQFDGDPRHVAGTQRDQLDHGHRRRLQARRGHRPLARAAGRRFRRRLAEDQQRRGQCQGSRARDRSRRRFLAL